MHNKHLHYFIQNNSLPGALSELIFHVKRSNVAHIISSTPSQIGENVINISENLQSQILASFDHVALKRRKLVERNKQHMFADLSKQSFEMTGIMPRL